LLCGLLLASATMIATSAPAAAGTTPNRCSACLPGSPIGRLESFIVSVGHPTLCQVSDISPTDQGGTSTIEILSYSKSKRCDPRSTVHQGVLYLDRSPTAADAQYLLQLASVTPAFIVGWQSGTVAILIGKGTSVLHQLEAFRGLVGHAQIRFNQNAT
jgi:hypothetical protein